MSTRAARLFVLFVGLSVATRWLSLAVEVVDLDETCHILGARVLASGQLLYTAFVDNKPPFLYVYYALAQAIAGRGLFAVHLVTVLLVVPLTALAVSAFYDHTRTGIVAAIAFLLFSAAFIGHDMLAANAEIVMILPASWALVLLRRGPMALTLHRVFAAGLLFGVAVLVKPQVATWAMACAAVFFAAHARAGAWRRGAAEAAALAVGVVTVAAAVYAWFAVKGGAGALLYWVVWHNLWYAENPIAPAEALRRFTGALVPFAVVTAPLAWATLRRVAGDRWPTRRQLARWLVAASIPPAFLGLRFYPHYFIQMYVPLALAAAPWLEPEIAWPLGTTGAVVAAWSGVALAGFMAANAVLYFGRVHVYRERDPVYPAVAERLRADPCAPAPLFVWGWASNIYYYADMPAASRFVVLPQSRLTGYEPGNLASNRGEAAEGTIVPEHWDWLMDDLERSHVTFIVDTAPANLYRWGRYPIARYPRLQEFVARNFELAADVRGVRIYRRHGCEPGGGLAAAGGAGR